MGRACIISAITILLSGCAMPIGLQMASFAIQGISMAATDKSVTDHGISAVVQEDCALWRVLIGDPVCRESEAIEVAIGVTPTGPSP
jgi:hypothetical protein